MLLAFNSSVFSFLSLSYGCPLSLPVTSATTTHPPPPPTTVTPPPTPLFPLSLILSGSLSLSPAQTAWKSAPLHLSLSLRSPYPALPHLKSHSFSFPPPAPAQRQTKSFPYFDFPSLSLGFEVRDHTLICLFNTSLKCFRGQFGVFVGQFDVWELIECWGQCCKASEFLKGIHTRLNASQANSDRRGAWRIIHPM